MFKAFDTKWVDNTIRHYILSVMRDSYHRNEPIEESWWYGFQRAWLEQVRHLCSHGSPVTSKALIESLHTFGVPASDIVRMGTKTCIRLDNLWFLFYERKLRNGQTILRISPHLKNRKHNDCWKYYPAANGKPWVLVRLILAFNQYYPETERVARDAWLDGLREQKIREIKLQTARPFVLDYFGGEIPDAVYDITISDDTPGDMQYIRLNLCNGAHVLIPFDKRDRIVPYSDVRFLDEDHYYRARFEFITDDETSEEFSIIRFYAYNF